MMNAENTISGKSQVGLTIYATLCVSVVGVLLLTNWPGYHFAMRGGPIPLYYFALPGLFVIPILFAEPASVVRLFKEPLLWWFVAYVLTGLLWLLASQDFIDEASRVWRQRVLELYFFFTIALLVSNARRPFVALVIVGCVLLMTAANWFDLMRPGRFVPQGMEGSHPGRGAGTFVNANAAATVIVMGSIAALPFVPMRFRGAFLVAALVGVAPTLSRSGFLLILIAMLGSMILGLLNRVQAVLVIVAIPLLIAATSVYYDTLIFSSNAINLDENVNRLRWFEGEEDDSSEERRYVAAKTRDMFLEQPLIGHGIGATSRGEMSTAGPHNMYVALMAEQGITGLALYLSLVVLMYKGGRRLARRAATGVARDIGHAMAVYAIYLAAYGWFSHNVLEEAHGVFTIAFLAAAAYGSVRTEDAPRSVTRAPRPRWRTTGPVPRATDGAGFAVPRQQKPT